jgi:hypothetical protein
MRVRGHRVAPRRLEHPAVLSEAPDLWMLPASPFSAERSLVSIAGLILNVLDSFCDIICKGFSRRI